MVEVGDNGQQNDSSREEIESGDADGGPFGWADRFCGEDECRDAYTTGAYACEEAKEGVEVERWR